MSDRQDTKPRLGVGAPPPLAPNVPAAGMQPTEPLPDPYVGKLLHNRYFVEEKLGEGGMGAVYRAQHVTLEKPVALKILHPEYSRKGDLVERFLQEARAASRIRHDNVIDISDFGTTPEGSVFFAMEYLEGRELHDVLTRAKLAGEVVPWERTRPIFLQVCAALSAAHAKGVIHRDLKPENIFLVERMGEPDFVKLLDFGIAKLSEVSGPGAATGERKLTKTGMLFGTPEYMSPEQARGEKVDHRVDVYAMGCILYQMLTGRVPFEGDNFMAILSAHISDPPPPILPEELARVGAPMELARIVDGALAKDRDERFATVDQLADAVRASATDEASVRLPPRRKKTQWTGKVALRDDPPEPAPLPARRGRGGLVALLVILLLAGGGGAYYYLEVYRGGEPTAQTQGDAGLVVPDAGMPASVTLVLDTDPPGADVIDQASGRVLGKTPLEYQLPGSLDPRRFRFSLPGHADKLLELVPSEDVRYKLALTPAVAGAASEPEVVVMPQKRRSRRHRRSRDTSGDPAPTERNKTAEPSTSAGMAKPIDEGQKEPAKSAVPATSDEPPKAPEPAKVAEPEKPEAKKPDEKKPDEKVEPPVKPVAPKKKADKPRPKKRPATSTETPGDIKLKNPFGK